jgi:hypothetical protein
MALRDAWATAPRCRFGELSLRKENGIQHEGMGGWSRTTYSLVVVFPPDPYSATSSKPRFRAAAYRSIKPIGAGTLQSTSEQVRLILGFFGFSKSELAKIMAVSRPALYAWLDGTSEPARDNAERLDILAAMARELDAKPLRPLFHGFIDRPVHGYSRSLLDILQDSRINSDLLRSMIDKIYSMTNDRERRMRGSGNASILPPPSPEAQDRNLEDNLSAIGAEG